MSATYDFLPDSIRIAIAETASPADGAAVRAFVEALAAREAPPTPQEIDEEFADVPQRIRDWIKSLISAVDWSMARRLLQEIAPYLFAYWLSYETDQKVEAVGGQVEAVDARVQAGNAQLEELGRKIEELQREWQRSLEAAGTTTTRLAPKRPAVGRYSSGRANPKGTPPRSSKPKVGNRQY